jgi:hypothetical protein
MLDEIILAFRNASKLYRSVAESIERRAMRHATFEVHRLLMLAQYRRFARLFH